MNNTIVTINAYRKVNTLIAGRSNQPITMAVLYLENEISTEIAALQSFVFEQCKGLSDRYALGDQTFTVFSTAVNGDESKLISYVVMGEDYIYLISIITNAEHGMVCYLQGELV